MKLLENIAKVVGLIILAQFALLALTIVGYITYEMWDMIIKDIF